MASLTEIVSNKIDRGDGTISLKSVFDPEFANLVEGQAVELTGYHPDTTVGGGRGVVKLARHNGGTAISSTRERPTDWTDQAQLTAWFADSGVDELCLVRIEVDVEIYSSWYGTKGNYQLSNDSTPVSKALENGLKVILPYTESSYLLNEVILPANSNISGGKSVSGKKARVRSTGSLASFITETETHKLGIYNLIADGKGKLFEQKDRSVYTAYSNFHGIESYASLETTFTGFFIFCDWYDNRDGYNGTPHASHQYIVSKPSDEHIAGTVTQTKTTNLNSVRKCLMFRFQQPAIDIEYAYHWLIDENCDFEAGASLAIRSRGCYTLIVRKTWMERNATDDLIFAGKSRGNNAHGTNVIMGEMTINLSGCTRALCNINDASTLAFEDSTVFQVPAGVVLDAATAYSGINKVDNIRVASATDSDFEESLVTSFDKTSSYARVSALGIGKNGVAAEKFVNVGFLGKTSVASSVDLSNNVMRLELGTSGNATYYMIPEKLLTALRGKTITFASLVHGGGTALGATVAASIWLNEGSPSYATRANYYGSKNPADTGLTVLRTASVTVPTDATSLAVGFAAGGATGGGSSVNVEALSLLVGNVRDINMLSLL